MRQDKISLVLECINTWHAGQVRSDGTNYVYHLLAVRDLVAQVTDDEDVLCAALLHDTIEDTVATYDVLNVLFGSRVAELVKEVTHERDWDGEYFFPHIKSREAVMIKLADTLHNLSDMKGWSEEKQLRYVKKKNFWRKHYE